MAKRGRPRKNNYLTSEEIYQGWLEWKRTGIISDNWAKQMKCIAEHMLMMPQFNAYPFDMKEEMAQEACLKIIKNIKNMREEKRSGFFSYWSSCCYTAFITYLRKYYRMLNSKRKILMLALQHSQNKFGTNPQLIRNLQQQVEQYENQNGENNDE